MREEQVRERDGAEAVSGATGAVPSSAALGLADGAEPAGAAARSFSPTQPDDCAGPDAPAAHGASPAKLEDHAGADVQAGRGASPAQPKGRAEADALAGRGPSSVQPEDRAGVGAAAGRGALAAGMASAPVPDADALRRRKRAARQLARSAASRKLTRGIACTLVGGACWGFSGTCASFLFSNYGVQTPWLVCVRQVVSGLLFLAYVLAADRARLMRLLRTPRDMVRVLVFAVGGLLFNQFAYLGAVGATNSGTATVLQCLQLVLIMGYSCVTARRAPRKREVAGLVLALFGTYLIATGGNPSTLALPMDGLAYGLAAAVGGALLSILPAKVLPRYGSPIVTGLGMLAAGLAATAFVHPWGYAVSFDALGWGALFVLVVVGSFFAYLLYMQGVFDLGSMRASLLGTIEPISATVTSALLLGIVFAPTDLVGFAAIIAMIFLVV